MSAETPDAPPGDGKDKAAQPRGMLGSLGALRIFEALHYREYRLIWFGQIFASMATWMDQVARGWLLYELTNSTLQLGLIRGVQAIPILLLSPFAGSAADRYSRKNQILIAQIVDGLLYVVVAILIFAGRIEPWHVFVTAFGMSIVQSFQQPSRAALVGDAVPTEHITNAIGLNSIIFNVARSAGPAFAGFLIALVGTGGAYTAQAICYFLATIWTWQLRVGQTPPKITQDKHGHDESVGQSIIEGWKFSWRNEAVRASLLIVICASIFIIPFMTLLPVFARDVLHVGATGQGLLLSAMGIGALCSSVLIASFGDRVPRINIMLGGRDDVRHHHRRLRALALVQTIGAVDGAGRGRSCYLPRPGANCHPDLLAQGISRPHHGALSHDPCDPARRRHPHRRAGLTDRCPVGDRDPQPGRHSQYGGHLPHAAARPTDPLETVPIVEN